MDIELTGTYPIIIDGRETGEVSVTREGLFWCFNAKSEMLQDIVRLSVFGEDGEGYLGVMSPENDALTLHKKLSRTALSSFPKSIDHCGKRGEPQYPSTPPEVSVSDSDVSLSESDTSEAALESTSLPEENEASSPPSEKDEEVLEDSTPQESEIPPPIESFSPPDSIVLPVKFTPPADIAPPEDMPPPVEITPPIEMAPPSIWRPCILPCSLFSDVEAKSAIGEIKGALVSNEGEYTRLAVPLSAVEGIGRKSIFCFDHSEEIDGGRYVICRIKNGKICGAS